MACFAMLVLAALHVADPYKNAQHHYQRTHPKTLYRVMQLCIVALGAAAVFNARFVIMHFVGTAIGSAATRLKAAAMKHLDKTTKPRRR